jgi:hypothetical protein
MRQSLKTVGLPLGKVTNFLCPIKGDLGWKTAGVFSFPYKCGKFYIGQTRHSSEARIKEYHQYIRLYHPDKSAVAEHSTDLGQHIQFQNTRILVTETGCMEHIIREATEIELPPDNVNRDGISLSKSWQLLLPTLRVLSPVQEHSSMSTILKSSK